MERIGIVIYKGGLSNDSIKHKRIIDMKLNNIWGYGQLFGYSGIEGVNRYYNDFIGTLTSKKIGIRFELKEWVKFIIPVSGRVKFNAVMSDFIDAETKDGKIFITFAENDTLVGYTPYKPKLTGQRKLSYVKTWNTDVYYNDTDAFGLKIREEGGLYKFCLHHSFCYTEARSGVNYYIDTDVEELKAKRYAYYADKPKCKDKRYERLYYKALSVNKVNVRTPEGKIPCMWTTPDRVPHRHCWLWDSVFHALAIVNYNAELAKNAIRAVISQQRKDGFMPHMSNPTDSSDVTQPQVLCWGVWEVYKKTGDKEFLRENVNALDKYLEWDKKNRDKNNNGLLEWLTEPDYTECKCGESGLDNSPRFDFDIEMDAIDFSTFAAHDAIYLSYIYDEIGKEDKANEWREYYNITKEKINELMWDEETGAYYDRCFDGTLTKVLTPASFLPMFANIPTKEQAAKMVKTLTNPELLWTELPLSTIAKNHPTYSTDMWRGGVWLNLNYFAIKGLMNYGYKDLAEELKEKTLAAVNKWYKKTGAIFEFFDSADKEIPYKCERKGKPSTPPDWRKHVHSIIDFNWSACFTLMFIQNELY